MICTVKPVKNGHSQNDHKDALAVCRAHRGLPVGFLLLR